MSLVGRLLSSIRSSRNTIPPSPESMPSFDGSCYDLKTTRSVFEEMLEVGGSSWLFLVKNSFIKNDRASQCEKCKPVFTAAE